ncbi:hypothetical protein E4U30_004898 [Claviceps sp. LM220 group G6]|nr:hypothetical protein E4U31_005632 [Claviceps sp. LM219 group G6]KAG6100309.1 hypothetical protein E4U30_004898 [Claviceps sp. LM220 group G6]KAG6122304.1 hypothetical protein E4U14_007768 [Claviceps sp. LM454 group G7]
MLATLPDFTPRDSHSLWYTSSRSTSHSHGPHDAHHHGDSTNHNPTQGSSRSRSHILERTALARLAADEQSMYRRRLNIQNFGSSWLRPLGVPKTLHQMREEKREQEEHQETLRREQAAQEYEDAGAVDDGADVEMMDDIQLDGAQDLDDEIPDADDGDGLFAMAEDDDDDDDDNDNDDDDSGGDESAQDETGDAEDAEDESPLDDGETLREERQNDLMAARMRMTDDAFREALVRGDPDGDDMYGREEELEEENQGHMLDEEDFAHDEDDTQNQLIDMDANLDDEIPDAESGLYEHTDSNMELSSSEEDNQRRRDKNDDDELEYFAYLPRMAGPGPPQSPTPRRRVSADPRESMDLSAMLSLDESSFMHSSPGQGRGR